MAFEKLSRFFGITDDDDYANEGDYDETDYEKKMEQAVPDFKPSGVPAGRNAKVVPMNQAGRNLDRKIVIFEPRIYADAKEIATNLLENQAVIVNFSQLEDSQARRIVDFLTGTVFAMKGEIQRVGEQIFLCTPPKFEIEGAITDTLKNEQGL
ncbi:cell division protein SepF [Lapidilactobacillus luobeiensis]|uniref:cell division protein SepF n=1 Tax=Lapidilactobacillus luobeiensis TaxID=2950371 RepID=UPI0021C2E9D2|nr:cell division protein SepF [Lapidilactobacillus luobeiensis]